jgi:O-antigen/teichoic acid export membrane protein
MIINNLASSFNDFGVNSALIHKKNVNNLELATALIIKVALGTLIALIAFIFAPYSVYLMSNEAIVNVIRVSSINFVLSALWLVPSVLLVRDVEFSTINKINTYSTIITTIMAVMLAYAGFGYWSLVLSTLINTVINVILYNLAKPFKIRFNFDAKFATYIYNFGGSVFLSKVVIQVLISSDNFIIGYIAGAAKLGYYSLAFNWPSMLCGIAYASIQSVIYPTFSKLQDNPKLIRQGYLKLIKYCALFGAVVFVTLFVIAQDFIVLILGSGTEKWIKSLVCLRIFCLYGFIRIILEPFVSICMAMGKPHAVLKANLLAVAVQLSLLYPAFRYYDLEGVAIVVTIAIVAQYVVYIKTVFSDLHISLTEFMSTLLPAFLLLPFTLIAYADLIFDCTLVIMIIKAVVSIVACLLIHGIITKWELEKELLGLVSR